MATHDYNIANGTGAAVRADINNVLAAIQSTNANSSAPSTTVAFQLWADTSSGTLKIRNAANSAFIELMQLDGTMTMEDGSASNPGLAFRDDLNTGIFSGGADEFNISTGGTERFVINSSGNCGLGTQSPTARLHVVPSATSTDSNDSVTGAAATINALHFRPKGNSAGISGQTFSNQIISSNGSNVALEIYTQGSATGCPIVFGINATERMRISQSGHLLLGTTVGGIGGADEFTVNTPSGHGGITIRNDSSSNGNIFFSAAESGNAQFNGFIQYSQADGAMIFGTAQAERLRINSSGRVGINSSNPANVLEVDNGSSVCFARISTTNTGAGVAGLIIANSSKSSFNDGTKIKHGAGVGLVTGLDDSPICQFSPKNGTNGNFHVFGALSKGSGSFLIDHPLGSKKDTHNLVHSFIEGPQADLIYRGKIALSDGSATVNIDTVSGMTSGTFAILNTNVQCFTNNETGWSAVKGSVSGNILTITAEDNSCSDTVSWLVIGERQDQHMKETDWTDNDGKVIVEPLKE
tara:strand:+ start:142 stop:1716 length:1575 start_codon:yes stop_codon:yes gene_type:complete